MGGGQLKNNLGVPYGTATKKEIIQCVYENYSIAKKVHNRAEEDFWGYILNCINAKENMKSE